MEEALVERLAQVLEKERKDEITALRLEAMYHKNFDRTLKQDLLETRQTIESIINWGLNRGSRRLRRYGMSYRLAKHGDGLYTIYKDRPKMEYLRNDLPMLVPSSSNQQIQPVFPHYPQLPQSSYEQITRVRPREQYQQRVYEKAKVSEVYDTCNEVISDLLEEHVADKLASKGLMLSRDHKADNFVKLVERAYGNYINGTIRDGRIYKADTYPAPKYESMVPTATFNIQPPPLVNDPPPPYRPPSVTPLPAKSKELVEVFDSDEDVGITNKIFTQPTPSYSRPSAPSMNCTELNHDSMSSISNLSVENSGNVWKDFNRDTLNRLLDKYDSTRSYYVKGDTEEIQIQIAAMKECYERWSGKIQYMSNFLFILKTLWRSQKSINCVQITSSTLDLAADPSGKYALDWEKFQITEADLLPLELLVPCKHSDLLNQVEVNPCIQLTNFYRFEEGEWSHRLFDYLMERSQYSINLQDICRIDNKTSQFVVMELNKHPDVFRIAFDTGDVMLMVPLPFLIPERCN